MRAHKKREHKILKRIFFICLILLFLGLTFCIVKCFPLIKNAMTLVSETTENTFKENKVTHIYDCNGNTIAKISNEPEKNLIYLNYKNIPQNSINAFVSIEDKNFWNNEGIDLKGIIRVCLRYAVTGGKEAHGASTITQQLARNMFLTQDVTAERKINEILIALELNKKYSKKSIMEFYINNIYFANGCYGLESASRYYFNKSANKLTLSETAYLCSIPNSPTYYDPLANPNNAIERRNLILKNMLEDSYISKSEYNKAVKEKIRLKKAGIKSANASFHNYETTYAVHCATEYLMKLDGFNFKYKFNSINDYKSYNKKYNEEYSKQKNKLYAGGYKIKTSINENKQKKLQAAVDNALAGYTSKDKEKNYLMQGAATCIDNKTRKVVAIVGGRTNKSKGNIYTLNRAYQSTRQPGSSIKPLVVYTPALEKGYTAYSSLHSINVQNAKGNNIDVDNLPYKAFYLKYAVQQSDNGSAWWLFCHLNTKNCINKLSKMCFENITPSDYNAAAALGGLTYGTNTTEMAGAYSCLSRGGTFVKPTCITSIKNADGKELYTDDSAKRIYKKKAAENMVDILQGVVKYGTASNMGWGSVSNIKAAGKTGTTDSNKDGWFCGITPYYTIATWVGYDTPSSSYAVWGNTYPCNIWKYAMKDYVRGKSQINFNSFKDKKTENKNNIKDLTNLKDSSTAVTPQEVPDKDEDKQLIEKINILTTSIQEISADDNDSQQKLDGYRSKCQTLINGLIDDENAQKYTQILQNIVNSKQNDIDYNKQKQSENIEIPKALLE